ncbi:MAG TPA: zinc finger domain-containing protein, partial [Myxococcaceae bacterium]|nr:zinc finger domain-containing protein [Myxococcaceae bacterium]
IRLASPFVLRSVDPPISAVVGRMVTGCRRIGKRIVTELEGGFFLVIHLMISGRLHWKERGAKIPGRLGLAALDFSTGTLILTEASTKKRASLHLARGEAALKEFERGGLEVMDASYEEFARVVRSENHTLKRAMTDPRLLSAIGNAYSDEILHRAKLSPVKLTSRLTDEEMARLFASTKEVLAEWTERLRRDADEGFPEKVTAFRPEMAVHGKFRSPCPVCGAPVQRIVHAENETNYCPVCQTEGRLLADRALSKLLHSDWPKTLEELEDVKGARR